MLIEEIIDKAVTNIYSLVKLESGGLDTCECFIELDNKTIIDIPFGDNDDIWIKELPKEAVSLFADLSDYPFYHVNKDKKTIGEIAIKYQKRKLNIFNRLINTVFGYDIKVKEYKPYRVEYKENKLKNIKGRKIIDFIWYPDDIDKGFFLLDNGFLITDTTVAPNGTGFVGLNYYESIEFVTNRKGKDYLKITNGKKGGR